MTVLTRRSLLTAVMMSVLAAAALLAQAPDTAARALLDSQKFKQAVKFIATDHDRFVRELIALTEIPAPPFKEEERARTYLEMLRGVKLSDVEMDGEGNVMGVRKGTGGGSMVAVLAHLDTVFPEGTDFSGLCRIYCSSPSAHRMPPVMWARKTGSLLQMSARWPSDV
jgi:hypothetical protein